MTSRTAYATVGSTRFDDLVSAVLSIECLEALGALGVHRLEVQHGLSPLPKAWRAPRGLQVTTIDYVPDVDERIAAADLVISHAGSGSVLAALRGPALRPKARPGRLVIVANPTLLDNHQLDLARAFEQGGWAQVATPDTLHKVLRRGPIDAVTIPRVPPIDRRVLQDALSR